MKTGFRADAPFVAGGNGLVHKPQEEPLGSRVPRAELPGVVNTSKHDLARAPCG